MMKTRSKPAQEELKSWSDIRPYVIASLVVFVFGLLLFLLLLWKADRIAALGLVGRAFYIVLLPFAVFVTVFVFGILKSFAEYKGERLGGKLKLGGAVVCVLLVIILGFVLPEPPSNFALTIYVRGLCGLDSESVSTGDLLLDIGGNRRKARIGADCEAYFTEIPANFRGHEVGVEIAVPGFVLVHPEWKVKLDTSSAYIDVQRRPERITGRVHDQSGNPIKGVRITMVGLSVSTDADGYFQLTIPSRMMQAEMNLLAIAPGFDPWSDRVVPGSNELNIALHRQK